MRAAIVGPCLIVVMSFMDRMRPWEGLHIANVPEYGPCLQKNQ